MQGKLHIPQFFLVSLTSCLADTCSKAAVANETAGQVEATNDFSLGNFYLLPMDGERF